MKKTMTANDPGLKSWVEVPKDSDFPIQNLPFGIFTTARTGPGVGVAIGNHVLNLAIVHELGLFDGLHLPGRIFSQPHLNALFELGRKKVGEVRERISELLRSDHHELRDQVKAREDILLPVSRCTLLLPVQIPNYTDFYSSEEHATNVGSLFRDPKNALLPNWKHLPVGYHGRASSVVVSGTPIHRPRGQVKVADSEMPVFCPSRKMDFELELAFITSANTNLGSPVSLREAEDHIVGFVLFNDWSARDIQQWEYVPLGPFLGKNFGSTMSPWVVTLDALEPFRTEGPSQVPHVFPYLAYEGKRNFDIQLEVLLAPEKGEVATLSRTNAKYLYWNVAQQLAHHTVNGCNIQVGDLYASGTISGPSPGSYGSLLELTFDGKKALHLPGGEERGFLQDGDTVIMRGHAERDGVRIGFGDCLGKILPAIG